MARLNEPPVAPAATTTSLAPGTSAIGTESIETLRRRFIRQNRELAKNNSSQSLRIRSLELEVSKILADNLDLREQNLALQNELHNARKQASSLAVRRMKCDLREKIAELSGMIDGLDEDAHEERTPVEKERVLSPSHRQYRERQPLAELMQEAVMPTISEDKQYPRRTLGAEEIRAIRLSDQSGASGSPDIGPPPVAHFDYEDSAKTSESQESSQPSPKPSEEELLPSINLDTRRRRRDSHSKLEIRRHSILAQSPVKSEADAASSTMLRTGASGSPDIGPPPVAHFDYEDSAKPSESQESSQLSPKPSEEELLPSINLDTRRRRRDSHSKLEIRRHSILAQSPVKSEADAASSTMLRTGAKRKLADREAEKPIKPPSRGDFTFSRRQSTNQLGQEEEKHDTKDEKPLDEISNENRPKSPSKPARKVLGEKSVNMSPKKRTARTEKPLKDDLEKPAPKLNASKERSPSRGRRASALPLPSPPAEEIVSTVEVPPPEISTAEQLQLYTPAPADDIFSPGSADPSQDARDTPPPADLSSLSNTTESGARPSRRARSAVNYAEPSLIAKMRRPGKQMVDAVTGLQDPKRAMNPSARERKSISDAPRTVSIKKEPMDEDEDWKDVASAKHEVSVVGEGSPLKEKSTDEHPPATTTIIEQASAPHGRASSASGSTLSSVIATNRKRRETVANTKETSETTSDKREEEDSQATAAAKKMEELDLYDFKSSSPPPPTTRSSSPVNEDVKTWGKRRHAMAPRKEITSTTTTTTTSRPIAGGRASSRRRSMML